LREISQRYSTSIRPRTCGVPGLLLIGCAYNNALRFVNSTESRVGARIEAITGIDELNRNFFEATNYTPKLSAFIKIS
jgi:hypothetical protein